MPDAASDYKTEESEDLKRTTAARLHLPDLEKDRKPEEEVVIRKPHFDFYQREGIAMKEIDLGDLKRFSLQELLISRKLATEEIPAQKYDSELFAERHYTRETEGKGPEKELQESFQKLFVSAELQISLGQKKKEESKDIVLVSRRKPSIQISEITKMQPGVIPVEAMPVDPRSIKVSPYFPIAVAEKVEPNYQIMPQPSLSSFISSPQLKPRREYHKRQMIQRKEIVKKSSEFQLKTPEEKEDTEQTIPEAKHESEISKISEPSRTPGICLFEIPPTFEIQGINSPISILALPPASQRIGDITTPTEPLRFPPGVKLCVSGEPINRRYSRKMPQTKIKSISSLWSRSKRVVDIRETDFNDLKLQKGFGPKIKRPNIEDLYVYDSVEDVPKKKNFRAHYKTPEKTDKARAGIKKYLLPSVLQTRKKKRSGRFNSYNLSVRKNFIQSMYEKPNITVPVRESRGFAMAEALDDDLEIHEVSPDLRISVKRIGGEFPQKTEKFPFGIQRHRKAVPAYTKISLNLFPQK